MDRARRCYLPDATFCRLMPTRVHRRPSTQVDVEFTVLVHCRRIMGFLIKLLSDKAV